MPADIRKAFELSYGEFCRLGAPQSLVQRKAAAAIMRCKTGALGCNVSICDNCGNTVFHNNSCRNRNCPNCQAVKKELWVDRRSAEVIDTPYFHVVFTLPHDLNCLLLCNQKLLYSLFHRCCAEALLELSADRKYLGAVPAIIQVLHTWNQELDYHVHMHCIVSGGGLTPDRRIRRSKAGFFIPVFVLRDKFKGKFLSRLNDLHRSGKLDFSGCCSRLQNSYEWHSFRDSLYRKDWCPYIKETFNGFGNAIEYLGRYTHKIAISNSRILNVSENFVTFSARAKRAGGPRRTVTLKSTEFIRRFLMHVLPSGFQKIRYYGLLNNRCRKRNLTLIFRLQGHQRFKERFSGLKMADLLKEIWNTDICLCPECGKRSLHPAGRIYARGS